jgi:hypothetical protein
MGSHCPFGHLKHKLWSKERSGVKLPIWLLTTKSWELTQFPCVQVACDIPLESSRLGLQLCLRPHCNQRSAYKVMGPQSYGSPNGENFGTKSGSLETKSRLDVAPMERCRVYYKGEGGGFPQVRAIVSLVCPSCSWLILAPKMLQLCTNHLVLVLCRSMWVIESCSFFLVPSRSSSMPLYPSKVLRAKIVPNSFIVFYLGLPFGVLQGVKEHVTLLCYNFFQVNKT